MSKVISRKTRSNGNTTKRQVKTAKKSSIENEHNSSNETDDEIKNMRKRN
jgi:hypothetical protein